jgi:hypothetical protein
VRAEKRYELFAVSKQTHSLARRAAFEQDKPIGKFVGEAVVFYIAELQKQQALKNPDNQL